MYNNYNGENKISSCKGCKFFKKPICYDCVEHSLFEKKIDDDKENDTDDLNHPTRYARNGVECIDIMIKIFGPEAVKIFCKLNAFKYLWRSDYKGKNEDIKKAVVYLNRYLEIDEEENNK